GARRTPGSRVRASRAAGTAHVLARPPPAAVHNPSTQALHGYKPVPVLRGNQCHACRTLLSRNREEEPVRHHASRATHAGLGSRRRPALHAGALVPETLLGKRLPLAQHVIHRTP